MNPYKPTSMVVNICDFKIQHPTSVQSSIHINQHQFSEEVISTSNGWEMAREDHRENYVWRIRRGDVATVLWHAMAAVSSNMAIYQVVWKLET